MLKPPKTNLPTAEATVQQRPVSVDFECPLCGHEISFPYREFCDTHGEAADWNGETVRCPNCDQDFTVDGQTWD